eukprot:CAMPEP_0113891122 /NCGR_PEP_ID=MMETSP0780_2-20120614/14565_1 /TAXON_ID=652834 /ORGANISM="Palpitomonas bilix" /LENGTH=428 /DNA_ID=CAMNT_0000880673 /DNA_START=81 /DNA_END=1367 /DNA_ORIENTATION=+ /assembly_acc=CAM_ASM_000599
MARRRRQLETMEDRELAKIEINHARESFSRTLYLYSFNLHSIPEETFSLTALTTLHLGSNAIEEVPPRIKKMERLQYLGLGYNKISTFPVHICSLSSLKQLYLYRNFLVSVPELISHLSSLEVLSLYENKLETLPRSLPSLHQLKTLELHHNRFTQVASTVLEMPSLENITLEGNPLDDPMLIPYSMRGAALLRHYLQHPHNPPPLEPLELGNGKGGGVSAASPLRQPRTLSEHDFSPAGKEARGGRRGRANSDKSWSSADDVGREIAEGESDGKKGGALGPGEQAVHVVQLQELAARLEKALDGWEVERAARKRVEEYYKDAQQRADKAMQEVVQLRQELDIVKQELKHSEAARHAKDSEIKLGQAMLKEREKERKLEDAFNGASPQRYEGPSLFDPTPGGPFDYSPTHQKREIRRTKMADRPVMFV